MRGVSPLRHSARPSSARVSAQKPLLGLIENALAGAIHEAQRAVAVEGENGDVDFLHHLAQQRGGFERAQSLLAKRLAERVHFAQHFAERIVAIGAARANRKITFAQRGQQIGKSAKRKHHAALRGECETEPGR